MFKVVQLTKHNVCTVRETNEYGSPEAYYKNNGFPLSASTQWD